MQNASLIQMGTTKSSSKTIDNMAGDPATFLAGLCVHLKSDGTLSLAASDGSLLGISCGRSLSDILRTCIVRKGLWVPILLTAGLTPVVGAQVQISTTTGKAVASGTAVNAIYETTGLSAVDESGAAITDGAAYISFQGGL